MTGQFIIIFSLTIFAKSLIVGYPTFAYKSLAVLAPLSWRLLYPFSFFCDGLHHGDLSVHHVMIVQSVAMHTKLDVYSVWLVDGESTVSAAIIRESEFFLCVLEGHDVRDRSLIEPYFSVFFDV